MAEALRNDISGIENVVPFHTWESIKVTASTDDIKSKYFKNVKDIIFTSPEYFNLFSYEWLIGTPVSALDKPFKIVLSESKAKHYFPLLKPSETVGKTILYQDSIQATVSGIINDSEGLTDLTFNEFVSITTIDKTNLKEKFYMEAWDNISSSSQLFIKSKEGVEASAIDAQFSAVLEKDLSATNRGNQKHRLQPLNDIHFNEQYDNFDKETAHKPTLSCLLLLSFFLLILACISYINLSTAQSSTRQKEISVRKTFGSSKKQLIFQFLGESIVKVFLATIFSISLLPYIFDHFSEFIPRELVYSDYLSFLNLFFLLVFIIILGVFAGLYPAFVLSAFKPAWLLKGKYSGRGSKQYFRQSLIVFQFATAFCLIIGSFVVSKQIKYGLTKDLGYSKDAIINVAIPLQSKLAQKEQFFHKLQALPDVNLVAIGGQPPASEATISRGIEFPNQNGQEPEPILAEFKYGNPDYIKIYNLKIIAGNHLSPSDTMKEVLINEAFAREAGYDNPQELIGQTVKINEKETPVVGVVGDFHSKSMHQLVKPLIITSDKQYYDVVHIKLSQQSENWQTALSKTEAAWKEVFPDEAFNYQFFDDKIASFYDKEVKLNMLLNWATGIAILISCLGLIGIVSLNIQTRTKEIGIRKVLGASVSAILMLLSKDFVKLIIIAFVCAAPVGYYFIKVWLDGFTYKIEIQWWLFVLPGLAVLGISMVVLSTQSIRAALANPVDSLKSE